MGAPSVQLDRRTTRRRKVSGTTCILRVDGVEHALEIGDISELGLQGETDVALHSGQRVELVFADGQAVRATVRWGVGPYAGLRFDRPIATAASTGLPAPV
jgi:hypothetical protein